MPLDKELEALLNEIKLLNGKKTDNKRFSPLVTTIHDNDQKFSIKKPFLLITEKKTYFELSHYFKIVLMSIDDTGTGLEIWLKGVLPLLLARHGIDSEEWNRICTIGDNDTTLVKELEEDWKNFFLNTIKTGHIDSEILTLINEGRKQINKIRKTV